MKELYTQIAIDAPVEHIWNILTDFERYPEWNPFIRRLSGLVKEGAKFEVELTPPGGKPMTFTPTCLAFSAPTEFHWSGVLFFSGFFSGEHIFQLSESGVGTLVVHKEQFKGILVPLIWKQLNTKTRQGFEQMNAALKERAERLLR